MRDRASVGDSCAHRVRVRRQNIVEVMGNTNTRQSDAVYPGEASGENDYENADSGGASLVSSAPTILCVQRPSETKTI